MSRGGKVGRLLKWLWSLYPPSFQERFGRELVRDLELNESAGRRIGPRAVLDALVTLVRSWLGVTWRAVAAGALTTDVSLAARSLRRAPGYAFAVVMILALALGANTAVFSVTHAVLLRALPYGSSELVYAVEPSPLANDGGIWSVDPEFEALPQIEEAALFVDGGGANLSLTGVTERVTLAQVTEGFFRVLGVSPWLGRVFESDEPEAAVLSYDLWVRVFAAESDVLGRRMNLNGRSFSVVGVMPDDVEFPSEVALWLPFPTDFEFYSNALGASAVARLRPDADIAQLRTIVEARQAAKYAEAGGPPLGFELPPVLLTPLREELTGAVRTPLYVLLGIAGLVVLLGCLNLASLVLARTSQRMDTLSIRRALGASRSRLFSQLIAEVLILSLLAGVVGLVTASLMSGLFTGLLPADTPGLGRVGLGAPVLLFAGGLAIVAGFVVGLVPSLRGAWAEGRLHPTRTATDDRKTLRTQAVLVVGQVAIAAVLVSGSSLLGRSLRNLEAVPLGYDLENVLTFRVHLPTSAYPDGALRGSYLRTLEEALSGISGVSAVGATSFLPDQDALAIGLRLVPEGVEPEGAPVATWVQVSTGYFAALGIEPVQGRPFLETGRGPWDRVVVSEALAESLFPDGLTLGARATVAIGRGSAEPTVVEAVVSDIHLRGRQSAPTRIIYTSMAGSPPSVMAFAVRATGDPTLIAESARRVALEVEPSVPLFDVVTTAQAASTEIATERAVTLLSRIFSASALLLAALGLYGLVSQGLTRRRRELGIRLAMGARPERLVCSVLRRPLGLAAAGLLAGILGTLWASKLLSPLLFGVTTRDPWPLALVAIGVMMATMAAAYVPARRIARIDPTESLRAE